MKLRDHPNMTHQGLANWPPQWSPVPESDWPTGEVGVLKAVLMENDATPELILIIEHGGRRYMGSLLFGDHWFCAQVYRLLQLHLETPIRAIGDLEVSNA